VWRWLLVLLIVGQVAAQEMRIAELQLEGCRVTDPQKVLSAIGFQPWGQIARLSAKISHGEWHG
jgi:cell division septal protein FtsQ